MKKNIKNFVRSRPSLINAILSVIGSTLLAIWVNFFTNETYMWGRLTDFWAIASIAVFSVQFGLVRKIVETAPRRHLDDILRLGATLLCNHAKPTDTQGAAIRGSLHVVEQERNSFGANPARHLKLVARYAENDRQDTVSINLENPEYKIWYYNVQAAHSSSIVAGDIDWKNLPEKDANISIMPREMRGVISAPMLDDAGTVIATVTFDSTLSAAEMNWLDPDGKPGREIGAIMDNMVVALRRAFLVQWD